MPATLAKPRNAKTLNSVSPQVAESIKREYHKWRLAQIQTGNEDEKLNQADYEALCDGTITLYKAQRLRRMLIAYLVGNGVRDPDIRQRLAISRHIWVKMRERLFGEHIDESERQQLVGQMIARMDERLDCLRRLRFFLQKSKDLTNSDRKIIVDTISKEQEVERDRRKLIGLDAPERIEVNQHKTFSVSFEIQGSQEQLADILEVTSQAALTDQRGE